MFNQLNPVINTLTKAKRNVPVSLGAINWWSAKIQKCYITNKNLALTDIVRTQNDSGIWYYETNGVSSNARIELTHTITTARTWSIAILFETNTFVDNGNSKYLYNQCTAYSVSDQSINHSVALDALSTQYFSTDEYIPSGGGANSTQPLLDYSNSLLVYTHDVANLRIYKNGTLMQTIAHTETYAGTNPTTQVWFARNVMFPRQGHGIRMIASATWSKTLTASEVASLNARNMNPF